MEKFDVYRMQAVELLTGQNTLPTGERATLSAGEQAMVYAALAQIEVILEVTNRLDTIINRLDKGVTMSEHLRGAIEALHHSVDSLPRQLKRT